MRSAVRIPRLQAGEDVNECSHRPPCPGCPRFGQPGITPAASAALDSLARAHGLPPVPIICGATAGFRLRARLAIRGHRGSPKIGLFETGTHRVVHIPNCRVQHPLINHVAAVTRRALVGAGVTSYSDKAHLGIARHLQVVVERGSQTAQVVLVGNAPDPQPVAGCLEAIRDRLGERLHSLWFNSNTGRTNTVLGEGFHRVYGPESVTEHFGGREVHYPPGAFGQSNLEIAGRLIEHIGTLVPRGVSVAEFYAGVGAIGLSLLPRVAGLRLNELGEASLAGLKLGLARLDSAEQAMIRVVAGPAADACDMADGADVVIADPPRKGLDPRLRAHLGAIAPPRFLYVSCDLDSLITDATILTAGRLRLAALTAFNQMPFTDHVETLACFERR